MSGFICNSKDRVRSMEVTSAPRNFVAAIFADWFAGSTSTSLSRCDTEAPVCTAGDGEGSLIIRCAKLGGDIAASAAGGEEALLADRLAWSMVTRAHPWDCVARLRRPSAASSAAAPATGSGGEDGTDGTGSAALRRTLARLDDMLHAQEHHSRPHYAALMAARKVRRADEQL